MAKPKFDPNKPFVAVGKKKKTAPKFDPKKKFKALKPEKPAEDIIPHQEEVVGTVREFATGATFGAAPFAEAGVRTLAGPETFEEEMEMIQKERGEFQEEHPALALGADIAGGFATGTGLARGGGKIVGKLLTQTALGAGEGALRAEAEGGDVGTTAVIGGALPGALPLAGKIRSKLAKLFGTHKAATEKAVKALGPLPKELAEDLPELQRTGDILLEKGVVTSGVTKRKALEKLVGRSRLNFDLDDELMSVVDSTDYVRGGLIGGMSKEVDNVIDEMSRFSKTKTSASDIFSEIKEKQATILADPTTAISEREMSQRSRNIMDKLGVKVDPETGETISERTWTLAQLHQFKKNLGKEMNDKFFAETAVQGPQKRQAMADLYIAVKNKIEDQASGMGSIPFRGGAMPAGEAIKQLNRENGALIKAASIAKTGVAKEVRATGLPRVLDPRNVGIGAGAVALAAGRATPEAILTGITAFGALSAVEKFGTQAVAETLSKYRVGRSASEMFKNRDVVLAKIMAMGSPKLAKLFREAVDDNPESLGSLVPVFMEHIPGLFMSSAYASEFDGKLHNPADKRIYIERTRRDDNLSNAEKMRRVDLMNKNGTLTDDRNKAPKQELDSVINKMRVQSIEMPPINIEGISRKIAQ